MVNHAEIRFSGKYDKKVFFRAVHLANQPSRRKPWVLPAIAMAVMVVFVILVIRLISSRDIIENASYIAIIMIAGGFTARSYLLPYLAARKLWKNRSIHEEHMGNISQTAIVYHLKIGKNEIPWQRFARVRKTNDFTALVTRDGLLIIFPKEFFRSSSDWERFNRLVGSKVIATN